VKAVFRVFCVCGNRYSWARIFHLTAGNTPSRALQYSYPIHSSHCFGSVAAVRVWYRIGMVALSWWVGSYAVVVGILLFKHAS
jgi:hypothetical protein